MLLPDDLRMAPRWVLPVVEGLLLLALVAGDPGRINRRSAFLRAVAITLVAVLALSAVWSTVHLVDDLIHGGPETGSASSLLQTGGTVWVGTILAFSLLYYELDNGGAAARAHHMPPHPGTCLPPAAQPGTGCGRLAPPLHRLPLPRGHQLNRLQPDRRHAVGPLGQDRHERSGSPLPPHSRAGGRPRRQRACLKSAKPYDCLHVMARSFPSHASFSAWGPPGPRSGPIPDQPAPRSCSDFRFAWSEWVRLLYHQQTKNMLVSYSPKKLGFF